MTPTIRIVLTLLACSAAAAASANIVRNPGFEEGALHWNTRQFMVDSQPMWARTGPGVAITACAGARCLDELMAGAYISQLLPTEVGARYDLGFWIRSFQGEAGYAVYWDGALLGDLRHASNGPMQRAAFSGLVASANSTLLEIHGRNDARLVAFDDVSVTRSAASQPAPAAAPVQEIPVPGTFMLVSGGLALLAARARRA